MLKSTRVEAPTIPSFAINVYPNHGSNDEQNTTQTNKSIISHRSHTHIATLNVRTIRQAYKQLELVELFSNSNTDILGIVDHKIVHGESDNNSLIYKDIQRCTLITQSAWRNRQNAANGGIGLLISKSAKNALADVTSFNSRILIAKFNGNPSTSVIKTYSPQEGTEDAINHYE